MTSTRLPCAGNTSTAGTKAIPRLIALYLQGRFPFDKLITSFPFTEIQRPVDESERGGVVKAVLRMS